MYIVVRAAVDDDFPFSNNVCARLQGSSVVTSTYRSEIRIVITMAVRNRFKTVWTAKQGTSIIVEYVRTIETSMAREKSGLNSH